MDQETLLDDKVTRPAFDPAVHGLWTRFVDNYTIRDVAWREAVAAHGFVGTCRHCGDYLVPLKPFVVGKRTDYEAECRNHLRESIVDGVRTVAGCGHAMTAPGGRLARPASSRTAGA